MENILIEDIFFKFTNVKYNLLNLPKYILFENGNEITYTYDAAGMKLRKEVKEGDQVTTTDYVSGIHYTRTGNQPAKLEFAQTAEGRIVPAYNETTPGQPGTIEDWDYQYHLTDHLGNVRLTFSTTPENYTMTEDFEEDPGSNSGGFQDLHTHTNANANTTQGGSKVALLQSGETGALVLLSMNKGDIVDLSVNANYEGAPTGSNFMGTAYSALFGSYNSAFGGGEATGAIENEFNNALSGLDMASKPTANGQGPKAYLNFLFFDKHMNYVTAGFEQISTAAQDIGAQETLRINDIIADQEGYLLAYLSNENQEPVNVHFDDFTMYHGKTNIVGADDYYPFGLQISQNAYQRESAVKQNYKYNGKEVQDELGLNWTDYGARMYDAAIGRFFTQDRFSEKYYELAPYQYTANNPILNIDINGDTIVNNNQNELQIIADDLNRIYADKYGTNDVFSVQKRTKTKKVRTNDWSLFDPSSWGNAFEKAEYEEVEVVDFTLSQSEDFDSSQDEYSEALSELIGIGIDIEVDIVSDTGIESKTETPLGSPNGLLEDYGGGVTISSTRILISDKLKKSEGANKRFSWTTGGLVLHELLYHVSPNGLKQGENPNRLREHYGLRKGKSHPSGSKHLIKR